MTTPKTASTLTISDIRSLFATCADANVVRACVRAIGAGIGGVFESEIRDYQQKKAVDCLVNVYNARRTPCVVTKHHDFIIASVELNQPFYIDGMVIRSGYTVCSEDGWTNVMPALCSEDGWTNVMPAACWFMYIADAMRGIDCLIEAGGSPRPPYQKDDNVGPRFWKLMKAPRT
jgi:predicted nuclease of predicted toxin-antitoxin system